MPSELPKTIYEYFSFKEGSRPNFAAMKKHFSAHGIFINNKGDSPVVRPFDEYAAFITSNINAGNLIELDEVEVEQSVQLFGKVGQISSEYKLIAKSQSGFQVRYGVNLFQVIKHGDNWKITAICWDDYPDTRLLRVNYGGEK